MFQAADSFSSPYDVTLRLTRALSEKSQLPGSSRVVIFPTARQGSSISKFAEERLATKKELETNMKRSGNVLYVPMSFFLLLCLLSVRGKLLVFYTNTYPF